MIYQGIGWVSKEKIGGRTSGVSGGRESRNVYEHMAHLELTRIGIVSRDPFLIISSNTRIGVVHEFETRQWPAATKT
jgi:hypothetical protein